MTWSNFRTNFSFSFVKRAWSFRILFDVVALILDSKVKLGAEKILSLRWKTKFDELTVPHDANRRHHCLPMNASMFESPNRKFDFSILVMNSLDSQVSFSIRDFHLLIFELHVSNDWWHSLLNQSLRSGHFQYFLHDSHNVRYSNFRFHTNLPEKHKQSVKRNRIRDKKMSFFFCLKKVKRDFNFKVYHQCYSMSTQTISKETC